MVTTRVVVTPEAAAATAAQELGHIGVALYHSGNGVLPGLGRRLPHMVARGLPRPPPTSAWDFLTIAVAVYAADRFVQRADADDAWTRVIALDVALREPDRWTPQIARLATALRFLTGDIWHIRFQEGGTDAPNFQGRWTDRNTVCLFSGGLDSLLGVLQLVQMDANPLLVSQGSPKEIGPQVSLANAIGLAAHRFDGRVSERWRPPYETSTRSRSLLFFAYGLLAASAVNVHQIYVPENGFIAINPPLTYRRIGALSTRTTHPFFLQCIEGIWHAADIDVVLINPFEAMTKGEMLVGCADPRITNIAAMSYSCGKGKRLNQQCGQCVPCLIRRAAFHHAGVQDQTPYYVEDLADAMEQDDVVAVRLAADRLATMPEGFSVDKWAGTSGPLPTDEDRRDAIVGTVARGMTELRTFVDTFEWP